MSKNCSLNALYTCGVSELYNEIEIGAFRVKLGAALGDGVAKAIRFEDCIVPVPRSGMYYAMGLAQAAGKPYLQAIVKEEPGIRTLSLPQEQRKGLIEQQIKIIPELIRGKNIVLVDEAVFTGITLHVVCGKLRDLGVGRITVCIPTPQCRKKCGSLPAKKLLAMQMGEAEMAEYLGVDRVFFQQEDVFKSVMAEYPELCVSCFVG